ncbi:NAD(P)-binding protein [Annulohypoxylon maeteangense]|uniref:NAD(P)-binding protein n=1 Tax=Annulohypoxylon maeteangense TaxID=1927788 RepID=UPI002008466E|nr:NAD(P)-binding protein [Annulohypoxylon maeteangense]KAI0885901.1 NAD(P)-binding protein [Annulohypoxylon maeteangense]
MDNIDRDALTWPYQLTNSVHRELYPVLNPSNPELSADGKTVLITGVSGGVGKAIAEAWSIAGASAIILTGRKVDVLNEVASKVKEIAKIPTIKIIVQPADLTSEASVKQLWERAAKDVGKIDVVISDAGTMNWFRIEEREPSEWWNDFEVNVKGPYLMCHYFLKQANGTGTFIFVGTAAIGTAFPNMSSYNASKIAQNKLMEVLHNENPNIRTFTLLPGLLKTAMTAQDFLPFARDDPMLSGGLTLFLCTPRAEWMRGGIMSVNWDIEEMEAHKEEIQREGRNKMAFLNAKLGKGGHPWET